MRGRPARPFRRWAELDRALRRHFAAQNRFAQRIFDELLTVCATAARHVEVGALFDQERQRFVADLSAFLFPSGASRPARFEMHDLGHVVLREMMEDDDFVEARDELRRNSSSISGSASS